jgi:hypothetical protein
MYFGGRLLFTYGYQEKEGAFNKYRLMGSVIVNVAKMSTIAITLFCGFRMATGKLVLQKALGIL